jgi:hypothetical protein
MKEYKLWLVKGEEEKGAKAITMTYQERCMQRE